MRDFPLFLLYALLKPLALLPLAVLYRFSDGLYIIIYHIVRYRRKVVMDNMSACFPDKSHEELGKYAKEFYRNFADYIVETIKLLHISDTEIKQRMQFENVELLEQLSAQGKSIAVYFSHCGNWEWAPSVTLNVRHTENTDYCQVYRPLKSKTFDALMLKLRGRFGSLSFPKKTVLRDLIIRRKEGRLTVTGFMSDQKPSHGDTTFITMFMNRPTAFIGGTEILARKLGLATVYWDMEKISRGRYRIHCRLIDDGTFASEPGSITLKYAQMLQTTIMRNPPIWLWTHKRWKIPVTLPSP